MNAETAPPLSARKIRIVFCDSVPLLKEASMVLSNVSMETQAAAKEMAFADDRTGLLYLRYRTTLTMATVSIAKVYVAMAIVVIS